MELSEILDDKPAEKPPVEKVQEAETKPEAETAEQPDVERATSRRAEHRKRELEAQGRDPETGQFVKKEEEKKVEEKKPEQKAEAKPEEKKPEAPKQDELTPKEKAAFAAAADERRKRQALEARIAQMQAQQPQQQPQPGAQPKSFWDDPEAHFRSEEQKRHQEAMANRISVSEMIARSKHEDFDEKIAKFVELAKATPGLGQQMLAAPDPAGFAYQTAKNHLALEQAGSMDKLLAEHAAKVRAEERAKVEAEFKAKQEELDKQRAALPQSLSGATGAGRRPAAATYTGPTPLEAILGK